MAIGRRCAFRNFLELANGNEKSLDGRKIINGNDYQPVTSESSGGVSEIAVEHEQLNNLPLVPPYFAPTLWHKFPVLRWMGFGCLVFLAFHRGDGFVVYHNSYRARFVFA